MPNNSNTDYQKYIEAAQMTVDLIDHSHTPDEISEALLDILIEMSAESGLHIWTENTGLRRESLAALYTRYDRGAGYRRSRLFGEYENGRTGRHDES